MVQDAVVALIANETVGDVLPAIHRAGFGHLARMIRNGRRPILDQLQRAGVPISHAPAALQDCDALLLVAAAARSPIAASLLLRHGADHVWTVSGLGAWTVVDDVLTAKPNVHTLPPHPAQHVPGLAAGDHLVGGAPPQASPSQTR